MVFPVSALAALLVSAQGAYRRFQVRYHPVDAPLRRQLSHTEQQGHSLLSSSACSSQMLLDMSPVMRSMLLSLDNNEYLPTDTVMPLVEDSLHVMGEYIKLDSGGNPFNVQDGIKQLDVGQRLLLAFKLGFAFVVRRCDAGPWD